MNNHTLPLAAAFTTALTITPLATAAIIGVDAGGRVPSAANATTGNAVFTFTVAVPFAAAGDVNLNLDMVHSWTEDCAITLTSPTGIVVEIFNHRGSIDGFENFDDTYFDDDAATALADSEPPYAGGHQAEGVLSDFNGTDPNGIWTLRIVDSYFGDYGWLYASGDPQFETRRGELSGTYLEIDEQIPAPGVAATLTLASLITLRRRRSSNA